MATTATAPPATSAVHEEFSRGPGRVAMLVFGGVLVVRGIWLTSSSVPFGLTYSSALHC
jgi:hypothetical protein